MPEALTPLPIVPPCIGGIARCIDGVRSCGLLAVCALALAACAGTSAGLQKDGTYLLDRNEKAMDCQRLSNSIWGHLQVIKTMPDKAKAERQSVPPTAALAFGRLFGSNKGLDTVQAYDRERAQIRGLHRILIEKGCPPIDVERELAATDAGMAEFRN